MTAEGQSDTDKNEHNNNNMHETEKKNNISLCQWPKICDTMLKFRIFDLNIFNIFSFNGCRSRISSFEIMHETEKNNILLCLWPKICETMLQFRIFDFNIFNIFSFNI